MPNQMLEDDNWFAYDVNRESLTILELTRLFNIYFFAICWPQQQELNIARTHMKKVDIETHVIKKKRTLDIRVPAQEFKVHRQSVFIWIWFTLFVGFWTFLR